MNSLLYLLIFTKIVTQKNGFYYFMTIKKALLRKPLHSHTNIYSLPNQWI